MKLLFSYPWQGTASFRRETGCESDRNRKCFRAYDSNTTIKMKRQIMKTPTTKMGV